MEQELIDAVKMISVELRTIHILLAEIATSNKMRCVAELSKDKDGWRIAESMVGEQEKILSNALDCADVIASFRERRDEQD